MDRRAVKSLLGFVQQDVDGIARWLYAKHAACLKVKFAWRPPHAPADPDDSEDSSLGLMISRAPMPAASAPFLEKMTKTNPVCVCGTSAKMVDLMLTMHTRKGTSFSV